MYFTKKFTLRILCVFIIFSEILNYSYLEFRFDLPAYFSDSRILRTCVTEIHSTLRTFSITLSADELKFPVLHSTQQTVSAANRAEADKLYNRAIAEADTKNYSAAIQLLINAITLNPDHKDVREMFGYRLYNDQWRTDWEIMKLKDHVDHPKFGWIRKDYVKRYEAGERIINSQRWVSIAEETKYRTKISNGWKILTPHYEIITNHSLEEGVIRSRELEHLHDAWQLFSYSSLSNDSRIKLIFQKKAVIFLPMQHKVTIYRNKNDYTADLMQIDPGAAASNGYYLPKQRRAYFYGVPNDNAADLESELEAIRRVVLHEGSHQLFNEPRTSIRQNELPAARYNCWLAEGLAMFMETLRIKGDYYILGDISDSRLYAAKYNEQNLNFYIPFSQMVKMGMRDFQNQRELSKLYSQSAAMTHFLMFAENGKYREPLFKLVKLIHNGADNADSLSKLTGCSCEELDKKYKEFLKTIPDSVE
jgi:hypothetical protein